MDILDYLETMQRQLTSGDLAELERVYFDLCVQLSGLREARRIQHVNLAAFAVVCREHHGGVPICIAFHDQDPMMRVG
ncbi:hypothetical protein [Paenibacillus sp. y28]|uniref:hypothetical protein n=1 Tax=Paenibacillus sp. y28 TaxID=3129110 RepID=UPI00301A7A88